MNNEHWVCFGLFALAGIVFAQQIHDYVPGAASLAQAQVHAGFTKSQLIG